MGDDGIRTKVRYYLSTQCLKTGITEIFHLCSDLAQMGEIDKKHSHFQKSQRQRFILSRHSSYIAVTVNGGSGGENQLPSATSAIRDATLGQVKLRRGTGRVSMAMFWTEIHASTIPLTKCRLHFPPEVRFSMQLCTARILQLTLKVTEARPAPKPQPIGSFPFILLLTTAMVCVLFIIWRRSDALRNVVAHQCVQCVSPSVASPL